MKAQWIYTMRAMILGILILPLLNNAAFAYNDIDDFGDEEIQIGDIVCFGHYEQDANEENGDEPIEWIVLDQEDERLLLQSKYVLDCRVFNEGYVETNWQKCSLRRWLNNSFLSSAFTEEEAAIIVETTISNGPEEQPKKEKWKPATCPDTTDKVFLLSYSEYLYYWGEDFCTDGTAYANKQGAKGVFFSSEASQTTRSSGKNGKEYTYMYATIDPASSMVDLKNGISPVIWIDPSAYDTESDPYSILLQIPELVEQGDFEEAVQMADSLGTYSDGLMRSFSLRVQAGDIAIRNNDPANALHWYSEAKRFAKETFDEDKAIELIDKYSLNAHLLECRYQISVAAMEQGDLAAAMEGFTAIGQYKDSMDLLQECFNLSHIQWSWLTQTLGSVVNAGKDTGFSKKIELEENKDPHYAWYLGRFMLSGYTEQREDQDIPVFYKTPGDNLTLWFVLAQDIDALNKDPNLTIAQDKNGSDKQFQIPKSDFGRGALFVHHIGDKQNDSTASYFNFLPANDDAGANTRIEINEEGTYEVALDYEIVQKSKVGPITKKDYYDYRIYFTFEVRNGSGMFFIKDLVSGSEIQDYAVTENGFQIDLANSDALSISYTRYGLNQSKTGLDIREPRLASDGDCFDKTGYYEITVANTGTNKEITKHIFVGNMDDLAAYKEAAPTIMSDFK